ncbi:uncharacterized protein LOC126792332 [Argentina anserina]|uniref:uncharacterized protein LOC126792332 n=1 Tax=Argentina anserina TaxID=57926 RepID=UPI0021763346|nr:uncharacterized protein LOC126792332 [Potentilla anserina]
MAPKRKGLCGYAKRLISKRRIVLENSMKGSMDKFITRKEKRLGENNENLVNEEAEKHKEPEILGEINENLVNEEEEELRDVESLGEKNENLVNEEAKDAEQNDNVIPISIFDPRNWDSLDKELIDLLAEKGPQRDLSIEHSHADKFKRRFSSKFYTRYLGNGEKHDRELKDHEMSVDHLLNANTWSDLRLRLERHETIDKAYQYQIRKEKEHWRNVLKRIIAIVKFLAKYNLAFRGTNERLYEPDNGHFLGAVEMMAECEEVMEEHCRRIISSEIHIHYLGHNIQNELLHMMVVEIKGEIITKKCAEYFSVILDCTSDISHQEQMSLILRCVNVSKSPIQIEEFFLEFLHVHDTSGQRLFEELEVVLHSLNLDINNVRGKGYDNGSNMKGKHQGVQKKLLDINPRPFYTPCGCHCLNLTLCDVTNSCGKAVDFFGVLQRIYTLFAGSIKRWQILKDNVKGLTLKPLSTTRWESRIESVKPLRFNALHIREALLQLADIDKDPKIKSGAKLIATNELGDFEFLMSLVIWYEILDSFNTVSKVLQSDDMQIDVAINYVKGLIAWLDRFRESGFTNARKDAKDIADTLKVASVFPERRQIQRKRFFDESSSEPSPSSSGEASFRVHYFMFIIDQAKGSLIRRFEQYQQYEDIFGFIFTSESLCSMHDDDLEMLVFILRLLCDMERVQMLSGEALFRELKLLREVLSMGKMVAADILSFLQEINTFPVAKITYRILLTVSVTVASAERIFSKLKLLKSYLRSTMSQERLNGLALISIENEMLGKISCNKLIDDFAAKKARRKIFK